jgi:glycogen phosphorylase
MENLRDGSLRVHWFPSEIVVGIPHDVLVLGYNINTCDRLRLWRAEAGEPFDFQAFVSCWRC